jgi:hypothetical protein
LLVRRVNPFIPSVLLVFGVTPSARAVDTLETYEPGGLTRFEAYLGYTGLGKRQSSRRLTASYLLGVGITDAFSAYHFGGGEFSTTLTEGEGTQGFGLLVTPLDTYHFDLDLVLDASAVGGDRLVIAPGLELNVDAQPDMSSFGLFVRAYARVSGESSVGEDGAVEARRRLDFPAAIGAYNTFGEVHQVLVRYDATVIADPGPEQRDLEVGGLSVGYNLTLDERLELIHEVSLDVPEDDEEIGVGFSLGLVVRLP